MREDRNFEALIVLENFWELGAGGLREHSETHSERLEAGGVMELGTGTCLWN